MKNYIVLLIIFLASCKAVKDSHIVDNGEFLKKSELKKLSQKAALIKSDNNIDVLCYTTKTLEGLSPVDYGFKIFDNYPVGEKGLNNGVLILLSKKEHKVQILTGYGLEWILTDSVSSIIVNKMIQRFKDNDFSSGLSDALDEIDFRTAGTSWNLKESLLTDIAPSDTAKVLKISYRNNSPNAEFESPITQDFQFSDSYKLTLKSDNTFFDLYYSQYMDNLIMKINRKQNSTIYARMTNWDSKRLELLGVE